jgi:4-aminobutyrate aminotransferase-like enzyme
MHPLAATVTRADIVEAFAREARYFNTFGGNPVSAAVGLAVLDVIESEGLQKNALQVGEHLIEGLERVAGRVDCIGDIRGSGLFLAVELVDNPTSRAPATQFADRLVEGLKNRGVLCHTIGRDENILKLRPPMVLSQDNADLFLGTLDEVLADL